MILLVDNDFVFKMAACNLLPQALAALGVAPDQVQVLPDIVPVLKGKRGSLEAQLGKSGYKRAMSFAAASTVISAVPDPNEAMLLGYVLGIDPGEVILIGATGEMPEFAIATGDKKWLQALAGLKYMSTVKVRLAGRVHCFEGTLLRILAAKPYPEVRARIVSALSCDKALADVFAEGMATTKDDAVADLTALVERLRSGTGPLLS